nr:reverse transcriptase domain-containing protein [Tanacetum cinerariifolium]
MADNRTMKELLQAPTKGDVPNDVIKLMMFPYSLEGSTRVWYDKEPPNSILTWEDHVNKFVNQFFPPSKTTHLKNKISRFTQRFEETFGEAWERFKIMLRACTHHGFMELTQIDTFYNGLNENDQDSLNAAAGGNLLRFQNQPFQVPNNQVQQGFSNEFLSYKKANDQMMRNMQNQINSLKGEFKNEIQNTMKTQQTILMKQQNAFQNNLQNMLSGFFQNQALTSGTISSNTIPNPKGEMKAITTRSGVAYEGPSILTPKKVVEQETEETTDKEQTNFQGSTAHIQPPVVPIPEPDVPKTLPKPNISYPSRLNDQKLHEKDTNQMEQFFQIFQDLHFDISFTDALLLMPKFTSTIKSLLADKHKLFELAKIPLNENCSAMLLKKLLKKLGDLGKFLIPCDFPGMDVCHALADLGASINLMPLSIWKNLSLPKLTPTRMTLELADRSITRPKGVAEDVFVKVRKFHFSTDFIVVDFEANPLVPLILGRSFLRTGRALIDVYVEEITLRVNEKAVTFSLNQTIRYSSTYDDMLVNRIDVIDVAREEYAQEMLDLKQGEVVKAKSLIEQPSELELKDFPSFGICLPRSSWVSPIHCVPKKDGITVVENKNNELIPTQLVTGRSCTSECAEVYYECKEPFKSLKCLWVESKSIAATWLEKVVTPLFEPEIKVEFLRISLTGFRSCISRSQTRAS